MEKTGFNKTKTRIAVFIIAVISMAAAGFVPGGAQKTARADEYTPGLNVGRGADGVIYVDITYNGGIAWGNPYNVHWGITNSSSNIAGLTSIDGLVKESMSPYLNSFQIYKNDAFSFVQGVPSRFYVPESFQRLMKEGNTFTFYCLIFSSQGGYMMSERSDFFYEIIISLPPEPAEPHYNFIGWYLDEALTIPYDGREITKDMIFYAKFELKIYTVTFNTGEFGGLVSPVQVTALTSVSEPAELSVLGYVMKGWYKDAAHTVPYDFGAPVEGDITVYAKWEMARYKVTFMVGGAVYAVIEVQYGTTFRAVAQALRQATMSNISLYDVSENDIVTDDVTIEGDAEKTTEGRIVDFFNKYWIVMAICGGALLVFIGLISAMVKKKG